MDAGSSPTLESVTTGQPAPADAAIRAVEPTVPLGVACDEAKLRPELFVGRRVVFVAAR